MVFDVFVHGNTGRKHVSVFPRERREEIRRIYLEEFPDACFTHFREIQRDDYGIKTSASTLENILKHEAFIVSPLANRSTVIKYSRKLKKLKAKEKGGETDTIREERTKYLLDAAEGGARKPRSQYMGELIEMMHPPWNGQQEPVNGIFTLRWMTRPVRSSVHGSTLRRPFTAIT